MIVTRSPLPKNSVGTKQLKNGAVTGGKIKNGSVTAATIAPGAVTQSAINPAKLGTVPSATNSAHGRRIRLKADPTYELRARESA